jgi:hypothetical protein
MTQFRPYVLLNSDLPVTDLEDLTLGSRPISMTGAAALSMDVIPDEEDDLTMANSASINSISTVSCRQSSANTKNY